VTPTPPPTTETRTQTCTVKLFGVLAQRAQTREATVDLDAGNATCAALRVALTERYPALAEALPACRFAVNHEIAAESMHLKPTDEVALIGLVSGG